MGSSASRITQAANKPATRQYPKIPSSGVTRHQKSSSQLPPTSYAGPSVHPSTPPQSSRNPAINLDARDPDFASRLSRLGPVQPAPTFSPSSTSDPSPQRPPANTTNGHNALASSINAPVFPEASNNPALVIIEAREQMSRRAEEESEAMGRNSFVGRTLIDVHTIKRAVSMKERGMHDSDIEKALILRSGLVKRLGAGKDGIIKDVQDQQ